MIPRFDYLDETETADCLARLPDRRKTDPEKAWLYRTVIYLGIAFCLAMILVSGALGLSPDPYGPAVVQHAQYGELYRRARSDVHEDCLEVWWETRHGEIKFRSAHCPSPLKCAKCGRS
jgi:hypothetical protein